ncbi:hypothetical protein CMI48_00960 [Candidatus Pacearchaeota archaeon]|nr:hypothetical protein [Candidatus Pacearchaeota archaeon]|tara:strand:- start:500 stop:751 length:252 start_codon:yes stop_codon:yes gene_type:complete
MAENSVITLAITFIAILITLIAPIHLPEEQKLAVIAIIIFLFLTITLSNMNRRLNLQEERLKISNELINIKTDIKELQRKKDG